MDITRVKRVYEDFGGVDLSHESVAMNRSHSALNVLKNYDSATTNSIETRKALKKLYNSTGVVYGMYFYEHTDGLQVIVHDGAKLKKWVNFPTPNTISAHIVEIKSSGMNAHRTTFFVYAGNLYIKDGLNYLIYNGTTIADVDTVATIPTTTTGKPATGGGTVYQPINLMSDYRYNAFIADGTSRTYQLDTLLLDAKADYTMQAWLDGSQLVEDIGFTVDRTLGQVTFSVAPTAPVTVGESNLIIKCKKTIPGYKDRIKKCSITMEFDHRIFFSGNQNYPSTLFHSQLDDPNYCSDLNYYIDGMDTAAIKSVITGNNALVVVKEDSQNNKTLYYHTPTIDYTYGKIYPSLEGKVGIGCIAEGLNFNDDIVFLSVNGLEGVTIDGRGELKLEHRSSLVDIEMTNETGYTDAHMEVWMGYLLCMINGKIYLADSRQKWLNNDHFEYEWYVWDNIGKWETVESVLTLSKGKIAKNYEGRLFIGYDGGISEYTGTDNDSINIESSWTLRRDDYGYTNKLKVTNKRGGIAKVKSVVGEIKVAVKTNKDALKLIKTYTTSATTEFIIIKVKRKKWIYIEYKFYSSSLNKPFGLYKVTNEAYVGSYAKEV